MTDLHQPDQQQSLPSDNMGVSKFSLPSKKKKLVILITSLIILLFLGVGAAAYNEIVLNNPDRIWDQAMKNTAEGFSTLSEQIGDNPAKGGDAVGKLSISEPVLASGTLEGSWYEDNAMFSSELNVSGIKIDGDVRIIGTVDKESSADTYIKINGFEGVSPLLNLVQPELADVIKSINGNWYLIDDSYVSDASTDSNNLQNLSLSTEELSELSEKINNLVKERLFSSDETKAVIIVDKAIGRDDFEYSDTYKYSVKIQKQQTIDFVAALQEALKGTKFESILQNSMSGENDIEVTPKLEDYLSKLEKLETPTIRAEAWVDMDLKYFRNVRIPVSVDGTEVTSYIDLGLEYDGGDVFPFYVQFSESTDKTGDSTFLELSVTLNKISKEMTLGFSTHSLLGSQNIVANGELKLTPSDKPVLVERPEGAKNVSELLNIIGQNSSFGLNDTSDKFDLNTLQLDDIEL